jgi:hypothetical protein
MIESLIIHRFRGIREGILKDIGKLNIFVGPNNSGKTALLEMLYLGGVNGRQVELILDDYPVKTEKTEISKEKEISYKAAVPVRYDFLNNEPLPRLRERHGHDGLWIENPASLTREGSIAVNLDGLIKKSVMKGFRLAASLEEEGDKPKNDFNEKDIHEIALDQEDNGSPFNAARCIADEFFKLSPVNGLDNVFSGQLSNKMNVVFYISTASSPDGNRDFDGYLLKIIDICGDDVVKRWLEMEAHDYVIRHFSNNGLKSNQIRVLGREGIPDLMRRSHWEILRSKTMLYAYITALQADKSHVWFSEKVIKLAPTSVLKDVFSNLIAAWYFLAGAENDEI